MWISSRDVDVEHRDDGLSLNSSCDPRRREGDANVERGRATRRARARAGGGDGRSIGRLGGTMVGRSVGPVWSVGRSRSRSTPPNPSARARASRDRQNGS